MFIHCIIFMSWTTIQSQNKWITVYLIHIYIKISKKIILNLKVSHRRANSIWSHLHKVRANLSNILFRTVDAFVKLRRKTIESLKRSPRKLSLLGSGGMWPIGSMQKTSDFSKVVFYFWSMAMGICVFLYHLDLYTSVYNFFILKICFQLSEEYRKILNIIFGISVACCFHH